MITKDIICITCPQGCIIKVSGDPAKGEIASCEGFKCPRGKKYAENEFIRPLRILTSSVKVEGASVPLVAVRTSAPIPKDQVTVWAEKLRTIPAPAGPIRPGQILLRDPFGLGVDILAAGRH